MQVLTSRGLVDYIPCVTWWSKSQQYVHVYHRSHSCEDSLHTKLIPFADGTKKVLHALKTSTGTTIYCQEQYIDDLCVEYEK